MGLGLGQGYGKGRVGVRLRVREVKGRAGVQLRVRGPSVRFITTSSFEVEIQCAPRELPQRGLNPEAAAL